MRAIYVALLFILAAATPQAAQQAGVMATIHQFFDSLGKGNIHAAVATCATPSSVVDEFPPHEWQGPNACRNWANAFVAFCKQQGISGAYVTLAKPLHIDVTGDRAYAVIPATYSYNQQGKAQTESAIFTAALKQTAAGWRMTGWAWGRR